MSISINNKTAYNNRVLDTLKQNNGQFIDDHSHTSNFSKAKHVAIFKRANKEHVVILYENTYFCLNPLVLDKEGVVHLSTTSVGGTLYKNAGQSLQDMVDCFNKHSNDPVWDSGTIGEIIAL